MPLHDYHKKRDFDKSPEPKGKKKSVSDALRFVVQRHAASRLHYDFRLEMDGVLKSWAIPKGPSLNPADKRLAMHVEDHPYEYRNFEGTIPKGSYGAGEVEIWDEGTYEPVQKKKGKTDDLTMRADLHKQSLKFILHGKKLKGEFALVKIKNAQEENAWLLIKHKDEYAQNEAYDAEQHTDPHSKVTVFLQQKEEEKSKKKEVIKPENTLIRSLDLSDFIKPMLCKVSEKPFDNPGWAFEIKWDGYRAIADLRGNAVRLYSRKGVDFSKKFKKITNALQLQKHEMVLDGEIVAFDKEGKPNFQLLQNTEANTDITLVYEVFDLISLNGYSTKELSYLERKELLKKALEENEVLKYVEHILEKGKEFFKAAIGMKLEGMIAKKTDSRYKEDVRSTEWLKIKMHKSDEALICGYTESRAGSSPFGALILGKYKGDEMVFCGHVGTGFNDETQQELYKKLAPLKTETSPFSKTPPTNGKAYWTKPEKVAEIKYSEITRNHIYRHPVFLRLREDIDPRAVSLSQTKKKEKIPVKSIVKNKDAGKPERKKEIAIPLTNLGKIFFPKNEISKGDIIQYYQSIEEFILPHLKGRPQSMLRFPNGITGLSFFQKDAAEGIPEWIETHLVYSESTKKDIRYILCNDRETLAFLNNLGCIDLNVWMSRADDLDHPDYLVLDLDPSKKNNFEDVIETAQAVKDVLDSAKLSGFPKTSGKTGMHIYIPMGAAYDFEQVKNFAHILMEKVRERLPELTTLERSLKKRNEKKVYLDYLQNRRGQTLAAPYSVRPVEGAPVSTPLDWKEVKKGLKPTDFNIFNTLHRLQEKGDLFRAVLKKGADMLESLHALGK